MEERLQKILARAGYGSRRSVETLISSRRVKVNGQLAILGTKADSAKDDIQVDGMPIPKQPEFVYIALHKPRGVLSDVDPNDPRQTVRDLVPVSGHLFAVGRLDFDSEGLILLTNDGELANRLTHPRYGHEKEYRVLVATRPDDEQLSTWRRGVVMEDGTRTLPARVTMEEPFGKGTWLRVVLKEGRKRQIREVGSRIGLPVARILRVRIGTLLLGNLKPREWRHLREDEVRALRASVGGKPLGKSASSRGSSSPRRGPATRTDRWERVEESGGSERRTPRGKPSSGAASGRPERPARPAGGRSTERPAGKPQSPRPRKPAGQSVERPARTVEEKIRQEKRRRS